MNAVRRQIESLLRVEKCEGGFRAYFNVDPGLVLLPDHFRGRPILPAICMVQAVLLAGARACGASDLRLCALKNAKMLQPVLPGDQVVIDAQMSEDDQGQIAIKAKISAADKKRAEFSLTARQERGEQGASQ
jgi:3-hydroxymyristoyl/3-hydroxydecanoyl-(acyl carrier protein) dehydratase